MSLAVIVGTLAPLFITSCKHARVQPAGTRPDGDFNPNVPLLMPPSTLPDYGPREIDMSWLELDDFLPPGASPVLPPTRAHGDNNSEVLVIDTTDPTRILRTDPIHAVKDYFTEHQLTSPVFLKAYRWSSGSMLLLRAIGQSRVAPHDRFGYEVLVDVGRPTAAETALSSAGSCCLGVRVAIHVEPHSTSRRKRSVMRFSVGSEPFPTTHAVPWWHRRQFLHGADTTPCVFERSGDE